MSRTSRYATVVVDRGNSVPLSGGRTWPCIKLDLVERAAMKMNCDHSSGRRGVWTDFPLRRRGRD